MLVLGRVDSMWWSCFCLWSSLSGMNWSQPSKLSTKVTKATETEDFWRRGLSLLYRVVSVSFSFGDRVLWIECDHWVQQLTFPGFWKKHEDLSMEKHSWSTSFDSYRIAISLYTVYGSTIEAMGIWLLPSTMSPAYAKFVQEWSEHLKGCLL